MHTAKLFMMLLIGMVCGEMDAMIYQEDIDIEDLDNLFSEDHCIEGTLLNRESGGPVIKSINFFNSKQSTERMETKNTDSDSKSPMSLISEIATLKKIRHQYIIKEEHGPSHNKRFLISLLMEDQEYVGEGSSIKRAQHEAARLALNSTYYEHLPKIKIKNKAHKYTPVHKLDQWARKHNNVKVIYSFIQQTRDGHANVNHNGIYSKDQNVHKVSVTVGDQQFVGEGDSTDIAKQNAASIALKQLERAEGFCMFDDNIKNIFAKLFSLDWRNHSPISLVSEFAEKSKLKAVFDLVSEEGPAHIKHFVYKCNVGEKFETFGEGTTKKAAKTEAAKNMVDKLKTHSAYKQVDCGGSLMKRKSKKKKSRNLIKSVAKSTWEEMDDDFSVPDIINPISKLIQIQQRKHDMEPVFRTMKENSQDLKNRFSIEVKVGELSCIGSGSNKKLAKKKAAECMLLKLGYSTKFEKMWESSSDYKKLEFFKTNNPTMKKKPLVPSLNVNSEKFSKLDDASSSEVVKSKEPVDYNSKRSQLKDETQDKQDKKMPKENPKVELKKFSQQLGFRFQFFDFPKLNKTGFVSLVSLTTDPPRVCYGTGVTTAQSQDMASVRALENLFKFFTSTSSWMHGETKLDPSEKEYFMFSDNIYFKNIVTKEDT